MAALCFAALAAPIRAESTQTSVTPFQGLDEYIEQARKDWKIPGLAVAIVKDDAVIFAKGFGTRTVADPTPVDADTLFAVGSTSKAFTAACIAMLVEEGKLGWDDRVFGP
jgi:CubicO group peptidase (beta-lactamase class C family)